MAIDQIEVERIARLAHLELDPRAVETLRAELESILAYVAALDELVPEGAAPAAERRGSEPTSSTSTREDEPVAGAPAEEVLRGAPDPAAGHFRVPRSFAE